MTGKILSREFKNLLTGSILLAAMASQNIESNTSTGASIYHLLNSCAVFCKKTPSNGEFKFKLRRFSFFISLGLIYIRRLNLKRIITFSSRGCSVLHYLSVAVETWLQYFLCKL